MDQGHHLHHHQNPQHHHQHQHQTLLLHQHQTNISVNVDVSDSRTLPQWSIQETKELISIRSELDHTFMETKRNKLLWEVVSTKMRERGYIRSPEQCKCKWKNLVTRYKGCETIEPEVVRQSFPFYNEMQTIYASRMQRMLWAEAEQGTTSTGLKKKGVVLTSDEDEENEESEGEKGNINIAPRKKRRVKGTIGITNTAGTSSSSNSDINSLKELLEDFMKQQIQIEMQWKDAFEERENERKLKEMEWRQTMQALENERLMLERSWREREEQRRIREQVRSEKRDALITALLEKLTREDK